MKKEQLALNENYLAIANAVAFVSTVLDLSLSCANTFLLQVYL